MGESPTIVTAYGDTEALEDQAENYIFPHCL